MTQSLAIIGGGPAGLMAAETASAAGLRVDLFDAMPTLGRKFLLAGRGGLNLSHAEPLETFLSRYRPTMDLIADPIRAFSPTRIRAWAESLGINTFVGSSQRIFPEEMKAAPLLRAWLRRLREQGVRIHARHRWIGFDQSHHHLLFSTPEGPLKVTADAIILALGGASWPHLGSDGSWQTLLTEQGISVHPLRSSNCGFKVNWDRHFIDRFEGTPLKSIAGSTLWQGEVFQQRSECVISQEGLEGGLIYALAGPLREAIEAKGHAVLTLDLLPDWSHEKIRIKLATPQGKLSQKNFLRRTLRLSDIKWGLLREVFKEELPRTPETLAQNLKALPIVVTAMMGIERAISSAGGIHLQELSKDLMLKRKPGLFCCGEMLDWDAPTGGYLLTACLATGRTAGLGAAHWLKTLNASLEGTSLCHSSDQPPPLESPL